MEEDFQALRRRVGLRIRRLRLARGLSQERLAELAGHERKLVGMVERGETNVGLDVLAAIARCLDVDAIELFVPVEGSDATYLLISVRDHNELVAIASRVKPGPRLRARTPTPTPTR